MFVDKVVVTFHLLTVCNSGKLQKICSLVIKCSVTCNWIQILQHLAQNKTEPTVCLQTSLQIGADDICCNHVFGSRSRGFLCVLEEVHSQHLHVSLMELTACQTSELRCFHNLNYI